MSNNQAWVTLATNDSYALGALVLAESLKRVGTVHQLAVLITPGVTPAMRNVLQTVFNVVQEVNVLDSGDAANLAVLGRPELGITFTKIHCWKLVQFSKCVFLDADTLVVQNCDELFERDELSAAPDVGWPDCFNSGVFVFVPSEETFKAMIDHAVSQGSFDGADQGLLNTFFADWATKDIKKHLPFTYNMVSTSTYTYLSAYKFYGRNVKIAHFIGESKPWLQAPSRGSTLSSFTDIWWDIFRSDVSSKLNTEMIINSTVFGDGLNASDTNTSSNFPNDRHVFVDPWESDLITTDNCDTTDIIDELIHFVEQTQIRDNEAKNRISFHLQQLTHTLSLHHDLQTKSPVPSTHSMPLLEQERKREPPILENDFEREPFAKTELFLVSTPSCVQSRLEDMTGNCSDESGLAGALAGGEKSVIEEQWRRQAWEQGNMDYMGRDSFENIWKKIADTVGTSGIKPPVVPTAPAPTLPPTPEAKTDDVHKTEPAPEAGIEVLKMEQQHPAPQKEEVNVSPIPEAVVPASPVTPKEASAMPKSEASPVPLQQTSVTPKMVEPIIAVPPITPPAAAAPPTPAPVPPPSAVSPTPQTPATAAPPTPAPVSPPSAMPSTPQIPATAAPPTAMPQPPDTPAPEAPPSAVPSTPPTPAPVAPPTVIPSTPESPTPSAVPPAPIQPPSATPPTTITPLPSKEVLPTQEPAPKSETVPPQAPQESPKPAAAKTSPPPAAQTKQKSQSPKKSPPPKSPPKESGAEKSAPSTPTVAIPPPKSASASPPATPPSPQTSSPSQEPPIPPKRKQNQKGAAKGKGKK